MKRIGVRRLAGGERLSDAELVERTRDGDTDAYAELWRRHQPSGLAVARATGSREPEDVVQEAFARVFHAIRRGGGPTGSFRAYVFTSIRNTAAGWGRDRLDASADDIESVPDPRAEEHTSESAQDRSLTGRAFRTLPARWQEVLWYTEVEQRKPAEIAPLLGLKPTAVAQLAFRAREGLREAWIQEHIADRGDDPECRWALERVATHVRGNLAPRDRRRMQSHLDECERCSAVAAEATELSRRLAFVLLPLVVGAGAAGAALAALREGAVATATAMPAVVTSGGASGAGAGVPGGAAVSAGGAVAGSAAAGAAGGAAVSVGGAVGLLAASIAVVAGVSFTASQDAPPVVTAEPVAAAELAAPDALVPAAQRGDRLSHGETSPEESTTPPAGGEREAHEPVARVPGASAAARRSSSMPRPAAPPVPAASPGPPSSPTPTSTPGPSSSPTPTPTSSPTSTPPAPDPEPTPELPEGTPTITGGGVDLIEDRQSDLGVITEVRVAVTGAPGAVVQALIGDAVRATTTLDGSGTGVLVVRPTLLQLLVDSYVSVRYVAGDAVSEVDRRRLSDFW